jgi:hypothetical protein
LPPLIAGWQFNLPLRNFFSFRYYHPGHICRPPFSYFSQQYLRKKDPSSDPQLTSQFPCSCSFQAPEPVAVLCSDEHGNNNDEPNQAQHHHLLTVSSYRLADGKEASGY